ncbi:uncharacterized protein LOC127796890 [Diospyros lotus]|uniref:uncharacterized protein LOC127796890 n=1 Tax=Diospyros lotus TaxID=55363 RepID=UPI00224D8F75|nr:uncharacterized protein LOC127796890 [Diospyros lotus]
MSHHLFLRIANEVEQHDLYFIQTTDAIGVLGLSSLQKITTTYRILAYRTPTDSVDEYIRIGESTVIHSLRSFLKAVIAVFGDYYLRPPNNSDITRLLQIGEQRGFLGLKKKHFAKAQESARKDVERAFKVLQARFVIVHGPIRFWDEETLADIMKVCIIMHNMVIKDEGDIDNNDFDGSDANPPVEVSHAYTPKLEDFMQTHCQIRDSATHSQLQSDLIEHL